MIKISVIVPCFNQAQYLDESLQSVLDQTYQDWECIIVNDGSSDETETVAKKWLHTDSRFIYFFKENGGLSTARNYGIKRAAGEWILPLDADDYISRDYLDLAKNYFDRNDLKVIYSKARKFGLTNDIWKLREFSLEQLAIENVFFCSAFFRKHDWERVGGYDKNLNIGLEDWDFWIGLLKNGGKVLKIDAICFNYRIKENSMLDKFIVTEENDKTFKYIEKKHIDFFQKNISSLHFYYREQDKLQEILSYINGRFFFRVINKIYSLFGK